MYEHSHIKQSYLSNDDALLVLSELVAVGHQVNQRLHVERMILSELSSITSKYLPCTTKQETANVTHVLAGFQKCFHVYLDYF